MKPTKLSFSTLEKMFKTAHLKKEKKMSMLGGMFRKIKVLDSEMMQKRKQGKKITFLEKKKNALKSKIYDLKKKILQISHSMNSLNRKLLRI